MAEPQNIRIRLKAFDHRLIDGAIADRFMARVKSGLEQFDSSLL